MNKFRAFKPLTFLVLCGTLLFVLAAGRLHAVPPDNTAHAIVSLPGAGALEQFAAREVRRYLYLRTGALVPVVEAGEQLPAARNLIVLAPSTHPWAWRLAVRGQVDAQVTFLRGDEYLLKTVHYDGRTVWLLTARTETGLLYAAYRFAERSGVRFYLDGDVVPDTRLALTPPAVENRRGGERMLSPAAETAAGLPAMDELGQPLFALRGIQPFHDFPEGPDWWNQDDYLATLAQLPKLRMNFFALHTYPDKAPNAEPTTWIGLAQDADAQGTVKFSYPASYQNTLRGNWGYEARRTGQFAMGAANLFDRDAFGPEVMGRWIPEPKELDACNEVFNQTAAMFREVFTQARRLGVKTCLGTETPLTIPAKVKERLHELGKNPEDPAVVQALYEGIFARIAAAHPLDYYWFWTPEGWTWEGTKPEQVARTTNDLNLAIAAARKVNAPFQLATCGWVLGPQQDRALFDQALPKEVAVSCINREVGKTPVDKGFAQVTGRGKWAIPWLEDDPALTAPQLWAGRMRRDARDARDYGCDGLMGIHWRTRTLGPAVGALAQAAWEQPWRAAPASPAPPRAAGPEGGQPAHFPNSPIADTEEDPVYQHVRYNLAAYRLPVSNGLYQVTLKFCEPHYAAAGKRVFGVRLQGRPVIEHLDIFARVGKDRALDFSYDSVAVTNGWLEIGFAPEVEFPSIAGIMAQRPGFALKINCGGPAWQDYQADWPASATPTEAFPPVDDFYLDWARHQFGPEVAEPAARIFARLDGRLPRPADWVDGPGGIKPDARPWFRVAEEYRFVGELATLAGQVRGRGAQERFAYWLDTFRYMEAMARINCAWAEFNAALARAKTADAGARAGMAEREALPRRRQLVREVETMYRHLLAHVSNPGELGTIANWEQHLFPGLLERPGRELAALLGRELPADAQLQMRYSGPMRVIVPTKRTSFLAGESLRLRVLVLAESLPRAAVVRCRPMGRGAWVELPLRGVGRGVYEAAPPTASLADDLEYYVEAIPAQGAPVRWPATAPLIPHTLVRQAR